MESASEARERAERLVAFAEQQENTRSAGSARRRRTAMLAAASLVVIGAAAAAGYFVLGAGSGETAEPAAAASTTATTVEPSTTPLPPTTTIPPTTKPATTSTKPRPTTTVAPTTIPFELDLLSPVRWVDVSGGVLDLRGEVPDEATVEQMRALASAVTANVVVEYIVFDRVARATSEPWVVRDLDFFTPGAAPSAASTATAELFVALMTQNPSLTMEIRAHTDPAGDPVGNQAVTQQQVDAIAAYLTSRGIDPSRLQMVGAGGTEPVSTDGTPEAAALNKRVEFVITGLPA
jgi:hypothetical protein